MALVGCAIFGCLTIPKYRLQVEDCFQTWCKDAMQAGWLIRFYTDIIPDDLDPALKLLCVNIEHGDTYLSATWKQWRGLEHMLTNLDPCLFYFTAGTDTFLNVKACYNFLTTLNPREMLYIGGEVTSENVLGNVIQYFGGSAIFLSKPALEEVLNEVPSFIPAWIDQKDDLYVYCMDKGKLARKNLLTACDLQLGIICNHLTVTWITQPLLKGEPHTTEGYNKDEILSTHLMTHDDFWDYWGYLQSKRDA